MVKALEFYEKGARLYDTRSLYMLGELYFAGTEVKQDFVKSRHYLEKALEKNNMHAAVLLGEIYFNGDGVVKDLIKSKRYFEHAYRNGIPEAGKFIVHIDKLMIQNMLKK